MGLVVEVETDCCSHRDFERMQKLSVVTEQETIHQTEYYGQEG